MTDEPVSLTTEQPDPVIGSGVQTDLFSLAGQTVAAEKSGAETPPQKSAGEEPAPVRTNTPSETTRKPLVFSEQDPYPRREGEKRPAESKKFHDALPRRRPVHLDRKSFDPDCTFGDLLKQAREQTGLTIEQVTSQTKLRAHYLIALENAELDKLPPPVYVAAYIRTLCSLYLLDPESEEFVHEKHSSLPAGKDVPRSLISDLESNGQSNEEENRRIKRMTVIGAAVLVLLAVCIIWGAVAVWLYGNRAASAETPSSGNDLTTLAPAGAPEFTDDEFDRLTAPQQMTSSSLKMSRKPALSE